MKELSLLILAAGIGSRFGGTKQLIGVGPDDEILMDYGIYDALEAGFSRIVLVVSPEIREEFERYYEDKEVRDKISYVIQEKGEGRKKPWGTGHAVLQAKQAIQGPFVVTNADDYYGSQSYRLLGDHLRGTDDPTYYCMAGFELGNTLSEFGSVSRGVCTLGNSEQLVAINETVAIERSNDRILDTINNTELSADTIVSMNFWGFFPSIFDHLEKGFQEFRTGTDDPSKEFYLPAAVDKLINSSQAKVKVERTPAKWSGLTYSEDLNAVSAMIGQQVQEGKYPAPLWKKS